MKVADIMTRKLHKVKPDDSIETVKCLMEKGEYHHLLVVEGKKLVGVISDRDLLRAISPFLGTLSEHGRDQAILGRRLHRIMSRNPVVADQETTVKAAAELLLDNGIGCLPVVNADGGPVGIVTWKDILRHYMA